MKRIEGWQIGRQIGAENPPTEWAEILRSIAMGIEDSAAGLNDRRKSTAALTQLAVDIEHRIKHGTWPAEKDDTIPF